MGIDRARKNDQPLAKLGPSEILGLLFSIKHSGFAGASPFRQHSAFVQLESDIPGRRHVPSRPRQNPNGDSGELWRNSKSTTFNCVMNKSLCTLDCIPPYRAVVICGRLRGRADAQTPSRTASEKTSQFVRLSKVLRNSLRRVTCSLIGCRRSSSRDCSNGSRGFSEVGALTLVEILVFTIWGIVARSQARAASYASTPLRAV